MLAFLFGLVAFAAEDCTLNQVLFKQMSVEQADVLKNFGASCVTVKSAAEREQQAADLFRLIMEAVKKNDTKTAKVLLSQLENEYSDTRPWRRGKRLKAELGVVGKAAPSSYNVEWFQGNSNFDGVQLIVFWELWCPHCKKEAPEMEAFHRKYKEKGLSVIGLTKLTRSKTQEEVMAFVAEKQITYPIGKEDGNITAHFAVSGIPAAAVVKDGKIIWRGHPATLNDEQIEEFLD